MMYIFILGNHKSGSTLLRSLLDNHKDIFSFPIETHPFKHLGFPLKYSLSQKKISSQIPAQQMVLKNLIEWIKLNNNQRNSNFGGNFGYRKFEEETFNQIIKNYANIRLEPHRIIEIYFDAIYQSLDSQPDVKYFAEKSVENFEYAEVLSHYFPKSKFIHIIRNPYDNMLSLRKYQFMIDSKKLNYKMLIESLSHAYYYCLRNQKTIKNYYVVKYEELVSEPANIMKGIAEFLEIEFSETLLTPTITGEKWTGNSVRGKSYSNISHNSFNERDLIPLEIILINKYLKTYIEAFNYSLIKGSFYKAFKFSKFESIKQYLKNRSFLIG